MLPTAPNGVKAASFLFIELAVLQEELDIAEDAMIEQLLDLLTGDEDTKNWADYENFIMIGIKPFMDAHTYDQDRIDRCCVHMVDRAGDPVSFCEYNALRRPQGLL